MRVLTLSQGVLAIATDAIRYSTMFVDKKFQWLRQGIYLLSQSILLQVDSTVPYCLFPVAQENPAMLKFVQKHLEPYLTEVTYSQVAVKQLGLSYIRHKLRLTHLQGIFVIPTTGFVEQSGRDSNLKS
ncbi:hypothetical protein ACP6PL_15545 [Dapis sp. BLCC M126]|uniref:hypothetical protein n=1 Tax=Dapis sp. BLCC M126 TaxID=3400189 RepID=UPI003CEA29D4